MLTQFYLLLTALERGDHKPPQDLVAAVRIAACGRVAVAVDDLAAYYPAGLSAAAAWQGNSSVSACPTQYHRADASSQPISPLKWICPVNLIGA